MGWWVSRGAPHPRLLCSPSPAPLLATLLPFRSLTPNPDASNMCEKSVGAAIKPQGQLDVWGVGWKVSPGAPHPPAPNPQPQALAPCLSSFPLLTDSSTFSDAQFTSPSTDLLLLLLLWCPGAVPLRLRHRRWPSPSPLGYLKSKKGRRWRGW